MANKTRRLTTETRQKVYEDWLIKTFPGLFNGQFLPMSVGIFDALSQVLPADITRTQLRATLGWYASRLQYLQNIRRLPHRINLDGSIATAISPAEKKLAEQKIKALSKPKLKTTVPLHPEE